MVKQISSEVKSQQTSSQKLARSMKAIWCIRAEMRLLEGIRLLMVRYELDFLIPNKIEKPIG
jgi:hypothetical protein